MSGKDPEKTFMHWIIEVEHWEKVTSYPQDAIGYLVWKGLPRDIKEQLAHLERKKLVHQSNLLALIKEILLRNYACVTKVREHSNTPYYTVLERRASNC